MASYDHDLARTLERQLSSGRFVYIKNGKICHGTRACLLPPIHPKTAAKVMSEVPFKTFEKVVLPPIGKVCK